MTIGHAPFAAAALVAATIAPAQTPTAKLAVDCASLAHFSIPASAIALPTSGALVRSAEPIARGAENNVNGDFCKVTGVIGSATASTAVFEFEVNLPNAWNGRALQLGGGGYDGSLVTGLTRYSNQPQDYDGVVAHYPAYNVTLLHLGSYRPGVTVAGMDAFPRWALLEGATFAGGSNFGQVQQPANPTSGKEALLYRAGDQTIKYIITRDSTFDPMTFDPREYEKDVARAASIMDVSDVSLEPFRARGGKIIMTHGTADDFITPHNSVAYYKRQLARFGQPRLDSFLRFYLIPGFGHGSGVFSAKFEALKAVEAWVEQGEAPSGADGDRRQP